MVRGRQGAALYAQRRSRVALVDRAQLRAYRLDHHGGGVEVVVGDGRKGDTHGAARVGDGERQAHGLPGLRWTRGGAHRAYVGAEAVQHRRRRLVAVELLGDEAVDEGFQRPALRRLGDLEPIARAAEVGDRLRIGDIVAAMRRKQ